MQNISNLICALRCWAKSIMPRGNISFVEPNAYIDDTAKAPRNDTRDEDSVERCYFEFEEPIHRRGAY